VKSFSLINDQLYNVGNTAYENSIVFTIFPILLLNLFDHIFFGGGNSNITLVPCNTVWKMLLLMANAQVN
jgi:hypothetical protein